MPRYDASALIDFAKALLRATGLDAGHCERMAAAVVEADLIGHGSHGLALLPRHIADLEEGRMTRSGRPKLISDSGASLLFDGRMLPGPVVVEEAIDAGLARLPAHGSATVVVRESHHILALAIYLERVARLGHFVLVASSNPWAAFVAPFGGRDAVYSPNPIACGFPTAGEPVLVDISLSSVAVNVCAGHRRRGERLSAPHLLDSSGRPTDDPAVLFEEPLGSILPLGGMELGYKGFGLGLMVEALTSALGGFGRADRPNRSSNAAVIWLVDPEAFGGRDRFLRETGHLARACLESRPGETGPVRLPGAAALERKRVARREGLAVDASLMSQLAALAARHAVDVPHEVASPHPGRGGKEEE